MKLAAILACALLAGCGLSNAQLRVAYHAANAADAGLTVARDRECMTEGNPLLGSDPSNKKVALFALGQSLLYELICSRAGDEERACRIGFLGVKIITDGWNVSQHIKGCD